MPGGGTLSVWTITEVEGNDRWSARLVGLAMPKADESTRWGVGVRAEDTPYHGQSDIRTEPIGLTFPSLQIAGVWRYSFFASGQASILTSGGAPSVRMPQDACDLFTAFCARSKVVEVVWSGGALRICRWDDDGFHWSAGRAHDRGWAMRWKVLSLGGERGAGMVKRNRAVSKEMLARAAMNLDLALMETPMQLARRVLGRLTDVVNRARQSITNLRATVADYASVTSIPAEAASSVLTLVESARNDLQAVVDLVMCAPDPYFGVYRHGENIDRTRIWLQDYDDYSKTSRAPTTPTAVFAEPAIPAEDWCTDLTAESQAAVQAFRDGLIAAANENLDAIVALFDALEGKRVQVEPHIVEVTPGESMIRLGSRLNKDWKQLAALNDIDGLVVPAGVTEIVVP